MPKEKNASAVKLIGAPEKLINTLIKTSAERKWSIDKITVEGPPHKQLQHTLVLKRLEKLIALTTKSTGIKLKVSKGKKIVSAGPGHEMMLPLLMPEQSMEGIEITDNLLDKVSKGPEHEILYTLLLLQAIEWLIATAEKKL